MIGWLNPGALWALPVAAVPILIHLLRTHHATRVLFPSLRFVQPSRTAAVRMRMPSDILLMLIRVAIVAAGVGALAGPIALTGARVAAWNSRMARAVVVDVSDSMRAPDGSGSAPETAAGEAAAAELRTATSARRIDARDVEEGLARASAWLAASPPARREIVVVSDLQRGALSASRTPAIPDGTGLRFIPVGRRLESTTFAGARLLGANDVAVTEQSIEATADATAMIEQSRAGAEAAGLRLDAPAGAEQTVARLLRAVAIAGAPAGSADQPIVVQFAGAAPGSISPSPIQPGWMLRTVLRLLDDPAVSGRSPASASSGGGASEVPWTTLAMTPDNRPLVRAAASGSALLLDIDAPADGLFAAEVVRAVLTARLDPARYDEHEVGRIDDAVLTALTRQPGSVTRDAWRTADSSDARWLWLVALLLLGAEQWLRERSARHRHQEAVRAAA
jgi:Aerotolerance regulator N-terminal